MPAKAKAAKCVECPYYGPGICKGYCKRCYRRSQTLRIYYERRATDERCRHCHENLISRPRGLCWTCFYTPAIRSLFKITSKFGYRSSKDFDGPAQPCEPTDALPGSAEKLAVLCERARLGQDLFHPLDPDQRVSGPWKTPTVYIRTGPVLRHRLFKRERNLRPGVKPMSEPVVTTEATKDPLPPAPTFERDRKISRYLDAIASLEDDASKWRCARDQADRELHRIGSDIHKIVQELVKLTGWNRR